MKPFELSTVLIGALSLLISGIKLVSDLIKDRRKNKL